MPNQNIEPTITETITHDNVVILQDYSGWISSFSYNGVWDVTDGQQAYPPPVVYPPAAGEWRIAFKAGRKKSNAVAAAFNERTGGSGYDFSPADPRNDSPEELNFFFGVDIQISNGPVTVYLAQGSNPMENNWWIGGACIDWSPVRETTYLDCVVNGEARKLLITGGVNVFKFHPSY